MNCALLRSILRLDSTLWAVILTWRQLGLAYTHLLIYYNTEIFSINVGIFLLFIFLEKIVILVGNYHPIILITSELKQWAKGARKQARKQTSNFPYYGGQHQNVKKKTFMNCLLGPLTHSVKNFCFENCFYLHKIPFCFELYYHVEIVWLRVHSVTHAT